jgi:TolB-like protein/Flp pilus assembly protein TadD
VAATLAAVIAEMPASLSASSGVRSDLAELVMRCLAKLPAARPASADELADALARLQTESPVAGARGPAGPVSIAVLPFADLSEAHDQGFLCDGLAEEILHALTRLAGLRVAARSSSFQFRDGGRDLRSVGERLDVEHVLEGSVRRSGDRLRITVQLVDVATGDHLWAERYDRGAEDLFAVQDEIAARVAATLSVVATEEARRAWRRRRTRDLAAYEAYLRGLDYAAREHPDNYRRATAELEHSVDLDPSFVAAWSRLAEISANLYEWYGHDARDLAHAEAASQRALALDPDSAEARSARGRALAIAGRADEAEREFELALAIEPRLFEALYRFARMRFSAGRAAEAVELFERAAGSRGDDYQTLALAVVAYEAIGDDAGARDCSRRALVRIERRLQIAPDDPRAHYLGAGLLLRAGERDRALEWVHRAGNLDPDNPTTLYNVSCILSLTGSVDEALDRLERAVAFGFGLRSWLEHDSDLDNLRSLPRFAALLARVP